MIPDAIPIADQPPVASEGICRVRITLRIVQRGGMRIRTMGGSGIFGPARCLSSIMLAAELTLTDLSDSVSRIVISPRWEPAVTVAVAFIRELGVVNPMHPTLCLRLDIPCAQRWSRQGCDPSWHSLFKAGFDRWNVVDTDSHSNMD